MIVKCFLVMFWCTGVAWKDCVGDGWLTWGLWCGVAYLVRSSVVIGGKFDKSAIFDFSAVNVFFVVGCLGLR